MKVDLKAGESIRISADGDSVLRTYVEDKVIHVTALPKGDAAAGLVITNKIVVQPASVV